MAKIIEIPQDNNDTNESIVDVMGKLFGAAGDEEDITKLFGTIIALPDEEFKTLSPVILDTYKNSINNPNDLMILAQAMNMNGAKLEDMEVMINDIMNQIDTIPDSQISTVKKDFFKE